MQREKSAIVVGAGIGGLCAAIALRQAGIAVTVYERAPEIGEIGAGLTLWANAIHALRALGLADAVLALSIPALGGTIRTWDGRILSRIPPRVLERRFGAGAIAIHRADLQQALLRALGTEALHLGATCYAITADSTGVTARFENGDSAHADLLVGADGLNSTVRAHLHGAQPPRYAGYTAWRSVTAFPLDPSDVGETWGCGARFGLVRLDRGRVYWFATINAPEGAPDLPVGRKREVLERFQSWHAPIPTVIAATGEGAILRNDIYDRPPLHHWGAGRVTLLGDAAHPMTPNLGQGACQAIEDAVVLRDSLAGNQDVEAALRRYEALRLPRTRRITLQSGRLGRAGQWSMPTACRLRNALAAHMPPGLQLRALEGVVGYHV
jgi:2-polyprenyl-6-methoxyphenol hydroxylase-like FAD-dependent oxidoreductase